MHGHSSTLHGAIVARYSTSWWFCVDKNLIGRPKLNFDTFISEDTVTMVIVGELNNYYQQEVQSLLALS